MPTVVRVGALCVVVRVRDEHPPPHVHVYKGQAWPPEWEIAVGLGEGLGPWRVVSGKPKLRDVEAALFVVRRHHASCLAAWEASHGPRP